MLRKTVLAVLGAGALVASPASAAQQFSSADGITVQAVRQLSTRLYDVAIASTAVDGPLHVRVLLPDGYDQAPAKRWPVLYLIHGTSGGASDWTDKGDAEKTTAGHPFITVMPDEGVNFDGGGYCTDWYNRGAGGKPMWETFEVGQVIPWVDRNLRTLAARGGRQIFGLSQGGFCAFTIAARHPDMFAGSGSFSGAIDTAKDDEAKALMTPVIQGTTTGLDGNPDPDAMFGPRATQELNWAAHDPATLVGNMRGMTLSAYTGNGQQGPYDPQPNPGAQAVEQGVHTLSTLWKADADAARIGVDYHDYGPGTHSWPYWARDLRESIGRIDQAFGGAAPARKEYLSSDDHWSQWGYDVTMRRPAREFSRLSNAGANGFILQGSGAGAVVTPPDYPSRSPAVVRISSGGADRIEAVRADAAGRLHLDVPLGAGNPFQQFTPQAQASGGTKVFTAKVAITAASRRACVSRRTITFAALAPKGARIVAARATVGGRRRALRHTRRSAILSLAGLPKGAYRVRLALTIRRHGARSTVRRTRTFRTCTPKGR
ncbi:MAG: alpha/beta hydrolase [Solirubrobacteraceae bacterium]